MKKIKRTITIRKVEINGQQIVQTNDENIKVCPVCHSPMQLMQNQNDSIIKEILQIGDGFEIENQGEKND